MFPFACSKRGDAATACWCAARRRGHASRPTENQQLGAVDCSAAGLKGRRGFQPRGKALGGSSAINAMLYVRGHRSDYDLWAESGCEGWSYDEVLPFFRKAENNVRGADARPWRLRPAAGLRPTEPAPDHPGLSFKRRASGNFASSADFNGPAQEASASSR